MHRKGCLIGGLFVVFLLSTLLGCSWTQEYGKLRAAGGSGDMITISQLYKDWTEYHILFAGPCMDHASAMIFDPISDDRTIVTDGWIAVKSQKDFSDLTASIRSDF